MNYWIIPSNPKFFNLEEAFKDHNNSIDWTSKVSYAVDDIVCIYTTKPVMAITDICKVTMVNIPSDETLEDQKHWDKEEDHIKSLNNNKFVRLKRLKVLGEEKISLNLLNTIYNINGYIQGPRIIHHESSQLLIDQINFLVEDDKKVIDREVLFEGNKVSITLNKSERNPQARIQALLHHGYNCDICSFNFKEHYNFLEDDYIHVHHKQMISESKVKRVVDPNTNLVPLCPNCHTLVHLRIFNDKDYEEVKQIIQNNYDV